MTATKVLKSVPLAQSVLVITKSWWVLSSLSLAADDAFQVFQGFRGERLLGHRLKHYPNHTTLHAGTGTGWSGCSVIPGADTVSDPDLVSPALSVQTPAKDSASLKYCKPCARCPPPTATWSPNLSAAATAGAAGAPSVSSAPFLEPPSTRKCVLMDQGTPLMGEVSWGPNHLQCRGEKAEVWVQAEFPQELAGADLHGAWSRQEASAALS